MSYTYNPAGNLASITYPSGRVVRIGYANGWPASVSVAASAAASAAPLITGLQFTASGDPKSWNWISGTSSRPHVRVFDQWGRVIRQPIGDLLRDFDYDFAGRISGYRHYVASNGAVAIGYNQGFAYDAADRLTTVYLGGSGYPTWAYTYDANGNRTSVARYSASPSPHTIASTSNRLLRTTSPSASFSYDASGNATGDGTGNALLYDLRGRLVQVNTASGNTARYSHDSAGWRVRKSTTVAGVNQTTVFVYDLMGQLLGEYDASGAAIREYIWLGNMPIALMQPAAQNPTTSPPAVYAIHTDHLNTPRAVVDVASNTLRWRWMAEPFGNTPAETTPTPGQSPMSFALRMPGQYWDAELGLFYNVQRDYSPLLGRYAQSDPIGLAGGINTYGYVGGNPISRTDRLGLATDQEIRNAVATLRCAYPGEFNKLARSIRMANLEENGQAMTDPLNNILLNSRLYGDSNTPLNKFNEYAIDGFLQTIAHEMLHINERPLSRWLSERFRMGNPLGYFHRQLDEKAESMITPALLKQFRDAMSSGDAGCTCAR